MFGGPQCRSTYTQYAAMTRHFIIRVQRGNCPFSNLKTKVYKLLTFLKRLQRLKQEWQKSPAGTRQTDGKNMGWFGEIP
jgi:hypothetical protein